jgi:hypothetical protein
VAQDAVGDLQVVVQLLEQRARAAELDQVVVRLGVLAHLVGGGTRAPLVTADDLAGALDRVLDVRQDLVAALGLHLGVEKERQVIEGCFGRHCGGGC